MICRYLINCCIMPHTVTNNNSQSYEEWRAKSTSALQKERKCREKQEAYGLPLRGSIRKTSLTQYEAFHKKNVSRLNDSFTAHKTSFRKRHHHVLVDLEYIFQHFAFRKLFS